jgi:hypothetical protein
MAVLSFHRIRIGGEYTRPELASMWGYKSFHAIARGLVTPSGDRKLIYFITEAKQSTARQYRDQLRGTTLEVDGPDDHFADERAAKSSSSGEELHLFYRLRHHQPFTYLGRMRLQQAVLTSKGPSSFTFELLP